MLDPFFCAFFSHFSLPLVPPPQKKSKATSLDPGCSFFSLQTLFFFFCGFLNSFLRPALSNRVQVFGRKEKNQRFAREKGNVPQKAKVLTQKSWWPVSKTHCSEDRKGNPPEWQAFDPKVYKEPVPKTANATPHPKLQAFDPNTETDFPNPKCKAPHPKNCKFLTQKSIEIDFQKIAREGKKNPQNCSFWPKNLLRLTSKNGEQGKRRNPPNLKMAGFDPKIYQGWLPKNGHTGGNPPPTQDCQFWT